MVGGDCVITGAAGRLRLGLGLRLWLPLGQEMKGHQGEHLAPQETNKPTKSFSCTSPIVMNLP